MSFLSTVKQKTQIAVAVALWIPAVGFGINLLLEYSTKPGQSGKPPLIWPTDTVLPRGKHSTLLMFVHPECPCTKASIGELARLMAQNADQLDAEVVFYRPVSKQSSWTRSELWLSASAIPRVTVHEDVAGLEATRFGAFTSGQTLLFDAQGHLLFKGGITGSRGHAGDNVGRDTVNTLVKQALTSQDQTKVPVTTPVLGCSLRGE